jgi:hypothetical protein
VAKLVKTISQLLMTMVGGMMMMTIGLSTMVSSLVRLTLLLILPSWSNPTDQAKGLEHNRPRAKVFHRESAGAAAVFLTMLEGMVYTIGAIFAAIALYLLSRWYKGQSIPFMQVFNPEVTTMADLEMQPARRMPITPDVIRT